jgi:hypothetical protein
MEFVQVQKSIIYHHKGPNNSEYKLSDSFYCQKNQFVYRFGVIMLWLLVKIESFCCYRTWLNLHAVIVKI